MKKILLFVGGVVISLFVLEGLFRYYFYRWNTNQSVPFVLFSRPFPNSEYIDKLIIQSSDSKILFELIKNSHYVVHGKPFITNNEGILGFEEYSFDKPGDSLRIVGVGDSMMSSWGVNTDETYIATLGQNLSKLLPEKQVQVINLSVPGYNTAIEAEIIEKKALKYHPDLIVLGFWENDMDLPNYIRKQIVANSYLYLVVKTAIHMLASSVYSSKAGVDIKLLDHAPLDPATLDRFAYRFGNVPNEYKYMVGKANYITSMKHISDVAAKAGVPVLLLTYADALRSTPEIKTLGYHILVMDDKINQYLSETNQTKTDIALSPEDFHLNAFGHQLYSKYLYEFIMSDTQLERIFKNSIQISD